MGTRDVALVVAALQAGAYGLAAGIRSALALARGAWRWLGVAVPGAALVAVAAVVASRW